MTRLRQAVILAGGLGTRLGEATARLPKPLMPIGGKPFLSHLVEHLNRQGIEQFVVSAGYKADLIEGWAEMMRELDLSIEVISEPEALGTGGAIRYCLDQLEDHFLVCNGDTIADVNVARLALARAITNAPCALAVRAVPDVAAFGAVELEDGMVVAFDEKGSSGAGTISAGSYILTREIVADMPTGPSSIERDVIPGLVARRQLAALVLDGDYFIDIGTPDTLDHARETLAGWAARPIAFLDRDGVLNHDHRHVHDPANFDWIDGAKDTVALLNRTGHHVVVVTNQAGIAKGLYDQATFDRLTTWMRDELWAHGGHLDAVYHCPFHQDGTVAAYARPSYDRKPNPGMLFRAFRDLPSVVEGSFFVGDNDTDAMAAEAAGVPFVSFQSGNLHDNIREVLPTLGIPLPTSTGRP